MTGSSIHHLTTSASETLYKCSISAMMGLLFHDTKSELIPKTGIPFYVIPVRPGLLPRHSNSGSISQNQALICSLLLSQGGCARTWQILLGLFASTEKMVPLGRLHNCKAQHCISQHWDFNVLTSNVDTSFPHGGGRFPKVEVSI